MTDKQNIFVQEYLTCLNATEAAKKSGYSENTAYSIGQRLLKNAEISQAINTALQERKQRTAITADYVLANLREIVERTMQKQPVIVKGVQAVDESGNNLWTFDAKNAIKALELIGKHLGLFTDKHELKAELGCSTLADLILSEYHQEEGM